MRALGRKLTPDSAAVAVTLGLLGVACGGDVTTLYAAAGGSGGWSVGGSGGSPGGGSGCEHGGMIVGGGGAAPGGGGLSGSCAGCPAFKLAGIADMPACCTPDGKCGSIVDDTLASSVCGAPGCYELDATGPLDPSCPTFESSITIPTGQLAFPGCCRGQTGTCGFWVDLTDGGGPVLGCMDFTGSTGTKQLCGGTAG